MNDDRPTPISWKRVALAAGGAAVLALAVHAQTLATGAIPRDTAGLELAPVPAVDLGNAGAPLAWLAHAAVAALLTVIVCRLTGRLFASLVSGLVIAAHPLAVEAVSWSEARAVPVAFALSLGASALWYFVAEDATGRRARLLARIGALAFMALGAVLHPMSAAAPVCTGAALSVMRRGGAREGAPGASRPSLSWPMVALALVAIVVGTALHHAGGEPGRRMAAAAVPVVLFDSVASFAVIWRLMPDYSALYSDVEAWRIVLSLVGLVLVFPVLERILRKRVRGARGVFTWIAVALVLGVLVGGRGERHDWALYPMLIGVAWLCGALFMLREKGDVAAALVFVAILFAGYSAVMQAPAWRSPDGALVLMERAPARAQLDFAERLVRMGSAKERRASDLERRSRELVRAGRDTVARDMHEEATRLREEATRLFRRCASAIFEAKALLAADDARLLSTQGLVALGMKDYGQARETLERAVEVMPPGPERADVLVRLGGAWEGIGDRAEAIRRYEQAATEAPEDPEPLVFMGMALRMSGEFSGALAAFRRATELSPDDATLQHRLGLIFTDMLMYKEAEAALLRALEADPSNESYRDDLDTVQRLLKGQRDPAKAKEAYAEGQFFEAEAARAVSTGDADKAYRLLISAADAYRRAIAYAQHNHAAHYRRGVCLAIYGSSLKKYEARRDVLGEAVGHLKTALLYDKGNEDYLFELGKAYQALGRTKEAEDTYRELLRVNPSSARSHYRLARLYAYQLDDASRARTEIEKAQRLGLEPEGEFLENLEDIEFGPRTEEEAAAERAAQSASSEAEISLGIEGPATAAAAYARAYEALAGFDRPLTVRKRAGAAALAARCWEQAKEPARALEWYGKAAALRPGVYDQDVSRVEQQLSATEGEQRE